MPEPTKILVVGATGATGRLLVGQLLDRGHSVTAVVRSAEGLPAALRQHPLLSMVEASLLDLTDEALGEHTRNCAAVASCLGHRLSFRGIYGRPRRLVTEAVRRLCSALKADSSTGPSKFVLMNTTGVRNRDLDEPISPAQRCVIGLLRALLPPHADNEEAADYLRTEIGKNDADIEWATVRPDGLIDQDAVTPYELHPSPTRSAIFDAGETSRINVAHFMADLITDPETWETWKGRMPVIYNQDSPANGGSPPPHPPPTAGR